MVYAKQAQKTFFGVKILVFSQIGLRKSGRNFFTTPLFPLEIFAQNEKHREILKKCKGDGAEKKFLLDNKLKQNKTFKIIFIMILIFLTGIFSDPFISTGTHSLIFLHKIFRI
ncbi:predicted protein [Methanosarcina acetivorans C2A]|uniref:Uncharacterized protein n=1 Tax=Methanosarcina acetivorans (strain ATCC 35395 / DSM 2834 / JCM 12185 / C2A) TaxID=188937 RepID=Q8TH76_METAC|nr:predicted protein [Methanosarcina acetivorans C2A]